VYVLLLFSTLKREAPSIFFDFAQKSLVRLADRAKDRKCQILMSDFANLPSRLYLL